MYWQTLLAILTSVIIVRWFKSNEAKTTDDWEPMLYPVHHKSEIVKYEKLAREATKKTIWAMETRTKVIDSLKSYKKTRKDERIAINEQDYRLLRKATLTLITSGIYWRYVRWMIEQNTSILSGKKTYIEMENDNEPYKEIFTIDTTTAKDMEEDAKRYNFIYEESWNY